MAKTDIDVLGIGNAIVDVLAREDNEFLEKHGLIKGSMALISAEEAEALYADMGPASELSGGSAANTIAGIAALGGSAAFVGKVADDQLGEVFTHDIRSLGVEFLTPETKSDAPTARSFIIVTPDAERTMNTYLGACQDLNESDIDEAQIARAKIVYLEGYLWDPHDAKQAFKKAISIAHEAGNKVALTLSDAFCVDRYRDEFRHLIETEIDILFANESEIMSLYQVADFETALNEVRKNKCLCVLTRSAVGASIIDGDTRVDVPALPTDVVDTTGAGDLYAAGFLYGYSTGEDLKTCGQIASITASEIISHVGARPIADLKKFVADHMKDIRI